MPDDWSRLRTLAGTEPIRIPDEVPEYEAVPPAPDSWNQRGIDRLESHRLPVHGVPSGQDPWAEAKAHQVIDQPGAVQSAYNYMARDPGNYLLPPATIAVNPATVGLFEKALDDVMMRRSSGEAPHTGNWATDLAHAWAKLRWPRYATQTLTRGDVSLAAPGTTGVLTPTPTMAEHEAYIDPRHIKDLVDKWSAVQGIPGFRRYGTGMSRGEKVLGQAIDTLMHEMTHYRQTQRGVPVAERLAQPGAHPDLGRLFGREAVIKEAELGVPYEQRVIEQRADKGGRTAGESYLKFLKLLAKKYGVPEPTGPASLP